MVMFPRFYEQKGLFLVLRNSPFATSACLSYSLRKEIESEFEKGDAVKKQVENGLLFAWVTALIAMLGSLYFSEIRQFEPCALCWYQRILMYPLVVILAIGIIRKDSNAAIYSTVLAGIGFCISAYHYSVQKLPVQEGTVLGCGTVPCTGEYINWLGFITIPFLAGTAFLMIFLTSMYIIRNR
jgi:disulfide bond formation protein DsbB